MPFAVFRRHQKKLLAIFAILAMFGFVLSDSLPALLNGGAGSVEDTEVVRLWGDSVRRSDLARMQIERQRANAFLSQVAPGLVPPELFGGTSTREMVDALILEKKAEELGMPADADAGNRWLNNLFDNALPAATFERVHRERFSDLTDEGLLEIIANQARILEVRSLPGMPAITPLDIYQAYRQQQERVSAFAVPFAVADYLAQVPKPGDGEIRAYFERYKDRLPDPLAETPGFKVPRRVTVELASIDADTLAKEFKEKLTEKELRAYYQERKADFPGTPDEGLRMVTLPVAVFAGDKDAKITPRLTDPFAEVRPVVESTLAEQKARELIDQKFEALRTAMEEFSFRYADAAEAAKEARESAPSRPLPTPGDLVKSAAAKLGLSHDVTPPLSRDQAAKHGAIGEARESTGQLAPSRTFAEIFFASNTPLYEPRELGDASGRRYLAWKVQDQPAYVPSLEAARRDVVVAWKTEKARALAERDARALAEEARKKGGDLKAVAGKRPVVETDAMARVTPRLVFGPGQEIPSRVNEIPQLQDAGEALRDALFGLEPKQMAVAANQPKTVYYVLALNQRDPANVERLFDRFGPVTSVHGEVLQEALRRRDEGWMASLRAQAGLPAGWVPEDEAKAKAGDESERPTG